MSDFADFEMIKARWMHLLSQNDLYLDFEMCVTILVKGALCSMKTFYSEEKDCLHISFFMP